MKKRGTERLSNLRKGTQLIGYEKILTQLQDSLYCSQRDFLLSVVLSSPPFVAPPCSTPDSQ